MKQLTMDNPPEWLKKLYKENPMLAIDAEAHIKVLEDAITTAREDQAFKGVLTHDYPSIMNDVMSFGRKKEKTDYMVRPNDYHIFEIDKSNGCYRSYSTRSITDSEGNRPQAQSHFTYENLLAHGFISIDKSEIPMYEQKHELYMEFTSWTSRPDGHGGSKGGTWEEFLEMKKRKEQK